MAKPKLIEKVDNKVDKSQFNEAYAQVNRLPQLTGGLISETVNNYITQGKYKGQFVILNCPDFPLSKDWDCLCVYTGMATCVQLEVYRAYDDKPFVNQFQYQQEIDITKWKQVATQDDVSPLTKNVMFQPVPENFSFDTYHEDLVFSNVWANSYIGEPIQADGHRRANVRIKKIHDGGSYQEIHYLDYGIDSGKKFYRYQHGAESLPWIEIATTKKTVSTGGHEQSYNMDMNDFNFFPLNSFIKAGYTGVNQTPLHTPTGELRDGFSDTVSYDVITQGVATRAVQYATSIYKGTYQNRTWTRTKHDDTWSSWKELATTSKINISLLNGWAGDVKVSKVGDVVTVSGKLDNPTAYRNSQLFNLPTNIKPSHVMAIPCVGVDTTNSTKPTTSLFVNANGAVWVSESNYEHGTTTAPVNRLYFDFSYVV